MDPKSGLVGVVGSTAGRVTYDRVGQQCTLGKPRFCNEPPPFGLAKFGFSLPVEPGRARIAGSGVVRGHHVIWVETIGPSGAPPLERVAFDARAHEPVARKENFLGMTEYFSRGCRTCRAAASSSSSPTAARRKTATRLVRASATRFRGRSTRRGRPSAALLTGSARATRAIGSGRRLSARRD